MNYKQHKLSSEFKLLEQKFGATIATCMDGAGIKTLSDANDYLYNTQLIDPSLIPDISSVEKIILESVKLGNKICIFGDYDADGITSSAILHISLSKLGADVFVRLPDRLEGYGISKTAIDECIERGAKLIITVDNGIRAINEIAYAKSKGISVIVLDHHIPGDSIPNADCIVDLHWVSGNYGYTHLTGSGLAFKVSLYLHRHSDFNAMTLVDLAAIGTIADVEELLGENRVITKLAISQLRDPSYSRLGIRYLFNKDLSHITAEDIAFQIGPCINACGRLDPHGAELPLMLLLTDNSDEASSLADRVRTRNEDRKKIQEACYINIHEEAISLVSKGHSILVIHSDEAATGIVGLLAGKLKEEFNRPAIVFGTKENGDGSIIYTGSARSISDYNILKGITECSDLLLRFGGHELAAGMSILPENFEAFRNMINSLSPLSESQLEKKGYYNIVLSETQIGDANIFSDLEKCEPFGAGNPKPIVKVDITTIPTSNGLYSTLGKNKQHLKLHTEAFDVIGFNMVSDYIDAGCPRKITAYGSLSTNYYGDKEYKQLMIESFDAIEEEKTSLMSSLASLLKF